MKPYFKTTMEVLISPHGNETHWIEVPTQEAICNWESYMEAEELAFYNDVLSTADKIDIALSANPFNRFADYWKNRANIWKHEYTDTKGSALQMDTNEVLNEALKDAKWVTHNTKDLKLKGE